MNRHPGHLRFPAPAGRVPRRDPRATVFLVLSLLVTGCSGDGATRAPEPLHPDLYAARSAHFAHLDAERPTGPCLVYLGDSITDRIEWHELWRTDGDARVLNRGIAGDTVAGLARRVREAFPPRTRACLVMIGINDLHQGAEPEPTARAITKLCQDLQDRWGVPLVVVESLLPSERLEDPAAVAAVNAYLARWASRRKGVEFLDLHPHFVRGSAPDSSLFTDGVHLAPAGVERRLQLEATFLRERLAPLGLALTARRSGTE